MTGKNKKLDLHACNIPCQGVQVPTEDELAALDAMRAIKFRGTQVKKNLSEVSSSQREEDRQATLALQKELEQLRREWKRWEKKRQEATKQRMILLGHYEYQ